MDIKEKIRDILRNALSKIGYKNPEITIAIPSDLANGDFTTNIAFTISKKLKKSPKEIAEQIVQNIEKENFLEKAEVAGAGFINFYISADFLIKELDQEINVKTFKGKKIMVEFAHPNTHKEMHIGHLRTLITGEAISRILEINGAKVFRANYQGDIGPHVAKAIYGIQKIMKEKNLKLEDVDKWSNTEKAHFLGQGYTVGNQDYLKHKQEIDDLNNQLYNEDEKTLALYQITRNWSLDYYEEFYTRFYTHFDHLFFENQVAADGKKIVFKYLDKVFIKDDGAIIFPGDEYGLHRRVFVTKDGNPTYEGKEMALAFQQHKAFHFDKNIHVVASEQAGYFKVVIKALELINPKWFKDKEMHLSMGMVHLLDRKMSSRTGDVLTVDWLIAMVKNKVGEIIKEGRIEVENKEDLIEEIVIGAIKYSILKVGTSQDVAFDIDRSVSLEGDSGPYLQYTNARIQSLVNKSRYDLELRIQSSEFNKEEKYLLRILSQYPDILGESAEKLAPNILCEYLYSVAKSFNLFYQKHRIIGEKEEEQRIYLAIKTSQVLKSGLNVLGIKSPEKM